MKKSPIQTGKSNPNLRRVSKQATPGQARKVVKLLQNAIDKKKAVGLAAPQIGENVRVILVRIGKSFLPMVNPEILERSKESSVMQEGCISLPGLWGDVERANQVLVQFLDENGLSQKMLLKKLDARVVQHEVDHLNGILFVDKVLSPIEVE